MDLKRFLFLLFTIVFGMTACLPADVQDTPSATLPPTETATPLAEESEFVTYQDTKNKFEITYSKDIFTPDT
jgi:hypothetical protein